MWIKKIKGKQIKGKGEDSIHRSNSLPSLINSFLLLQCCLIIQFLLCVCSEIQLIVIVNCTMRKASFCHIYAKYTYTLYVSSFFNSPCCLNSVKTLPVSLQVQAKAFSIIHPETEMSTKQAKKTYFAFQVKVASFETCGLLQNKLTNVSMKVGKYPQNWHFPII